MLQNPIHSPPALVAQLKVEQVASFQQLVSQIAAIDVKETAGALTMGDAFVEITDRWGERYAREAAKMAGVTFEVMRARMRVSRAILSSSALRQTRALNYTQLRLLAGLADPAQQEQWAQKAVEEGWTSRQLEAALTTASDEKLQAEGAPCAHCQQPLPKGGAIIGLTIARTPRKVVCGHTCAVAMLREHQAKYEAESGDPFLTVESSATGTPTAALSPAA